MMQFVDPLGQPERLPTVVSASVADPSGPAATLIANCAGEMKLASSVSALVAVNWQRWLVPLQESAPLPLQLLKW